MICWGVASSMLSQCQSQRHTRCGGLAILPRMLGMHTMCFKRASALVSGREWFCEPIKTLGMRNEAILSTGVIKSRAPTHLVSRLACSSRW